MGDFNNQDENNNQEPMNNQDAGQQPIYQQPASDSYQYQQPDPNSYQYQQPGNQYEEPKKNNGLAIGSMVCGIVSMLISCIFYIALPVAVVGLILGIISLRNKKGGKGMAIAGIITSCITLLFCILIIIGVGALMGNEDFMNSVLNSYY